MAIETLKIERRNQYVEYKVQHYRQRFNWDCGVSCVLMLLPKPLKDEFLQNFNEVCQQEGFGCSTWTIDLCYLLKRFGIKHCMYTTMLGVNEEHSKQGYYSKILDLDRRRVRLRFAAAAGAGLRVRAGALPPAPLVSHAARGGCALALVDAGLLVCALCKHNKLKADFRRCFGGGYTGHYILIVGYSFRADKLLYRDPALSARLCAISPARLHEARVAPGTDQDIILIYNHLS